MPLESDFDPNAVAHANLMVVNRSDSAPPNRTVLPSTPTFPDAKATLVDPSKDDGVETFLDSGCTQQLTKSSNCVVRYRRFPENRRPRVRVGNGAYIYAVGYGYLIWFDENHLRRLAPVVRTAPFSMYSPLRGFYLLDKS